MNVTSIILTGGKNLRLGRNKSLEIIAGKSLLERVYERVSPVSDKTILVTSREFPDVTINGEYRVVIDIYPEKGPLGGIFTGLSASDTEKNIIVGCDMPFINTALFRYMVGVFEGYDAVVPRLEKDMKEPLHSVYSRNCLDIVERRLSGGQLSVHSFIDELNVRWIEQEEIRKFDPELLTFVDINYQSDLEKAALLAEQYDL